MPVEGRDVLIELVDSVFFVPVTEPASVNLASALIGDAHPDVVAFEEQLRAAQHGADVAALDRLIADELLFTGPDGQLGTKAQDLESHRTGAVRLLAHEPEELRVRRICEDVHVTALRARLEIRAGDATVTGTYCYTRVWAREPGGPLRVVAGHLSVVADPDSGTVTDEGPVGR